MEKRKSHARRLMRYTDFDRFALGHGKPVPESCQHTAPPALLLEGKMVPEQRKDRIAIRRAVMLDIRVSSTASRLYFLLDDRARETGECWLSHQKLALMLGVGKDRITDLIKELGEYLTRERGRYGSVYRLSWGSRLGENAESGPVNNRQKHRVRLGENAGSGASVLYYPGTTYIQEHSSRGKSHCELCGGSGIEESISGGIQPCRCSVRRRA